MKIFKYLLFAISLFSSIVHSQDPSPILLKFCENNLIGYMDTFGNVVIPSRFHSAGEFSEGLAPVREGGFYGYIDITGKYIIEPKFEFAEPFSEGFAIAYNEGKPFYINRSGEQAFDCSGYKRLTNFINAKARVFTFTNNNGIVDKTGNLIIDTIYSMISYFDNGAATVRKRQGDPSGHDLYGVIDSNGNFIVPLGKYKHIENFQNGFAYVSSRYDNSEPKNEGFIDSKGNLLFSMRASEDYIYSLRPYISDSLIICEFKKPLNTHDPIRHQSNSYKGIMDIYGNMVYKNPNYDDILPFYEGRSFASIKGKYYLINKRGKIISENKFDFVDYTSFKNDFCFVRSKGKWGIIDRYGNYVLKPAFSNIEKQNTFKDIFFFYKWPQGYGISDFSGNILVEPSLEKYSFKGFEKGLLRVISNEKFGYLRRNGQILWGEKGPNRVDTLNIDYMRISNCKGYDKKPEYSNNFITSVAKSVNEINFNFSENEVSITITETELSYLDKYIGKRVFIANTTKKDILLRVMDQSLYLILQAQDVNGNWKDVESMASSFCGNSYYSDTLPENSFWEFTVPVYNGIISTKLRFRLSGIYDENLKTYDIYSTEFEGSINPAQFWRKSSLTPERKIDVYEEFYSPFL